MAFSLSSRLRPQLPTMHRLALQTMRPSSTTSDSTRLAVQAEKRAHYLHQQSAPPALNSTEGRLVSRLNIRQPFEVVNVFRDTAQGLDLVTLDTSPLALHQLVMQNIRNPQQTVAVEIGSILPAPKSNSKPSLSTRMNYIRTLVNYWVTNWHQLSPEDRIALQRTHLTVLVAPNMKAPETYFYELNQLNIKLRPLGIFLGASVFPSVDEAYSLTNFNQMSVDQVVGLFNKGLHYFRVFDRPHSQVTYYLSGPWGVYDPTNNIANATAIMEKAKKEHGDLKIGFAPGDTKGLATPEGIIEFHNAAVERGIGFAEIQPHVHARAHDPRDSEAVVQAMVDMMANILTWAGLGYRTFHVSHGGAGLNPLAATADAAAGNVPWFILECLQHYVSWNRLTSDSRRIDEMSSSLQVADTEQRFGFGHQGRDLYVSPMVTHFSRDQIVEAVGKAYQALVDGGKIRPINAESTGNPFDGVPPFRFR